MVELKRMRALREEKGWTQSEIAAQLGCSQRIYSNYERGNVDMSTDTLKRLALLHETSADYLLGLTNKKK